MNSKIIVILDDNAVTRDIIKRNLRKHGYNAFTANNFNTAKELLQKEKPDLIITDLMMPDVSGLDVIRYVKENHKNTEVIVLTGYPTINTAVDAVKLGADDYLTKPFTDVELHLAVKKTLEKAELRKSLSKSTNNDYEARFGIIGKSKKMQEVFKTIEKASNIDSTVLITGESGTGKELIARAIHYGGQRSAEHFVPINCGAIPETLLESELFGYKKGAFTNANSDREGFFQSADRGTIFLDEISETSSLMQIKLLRVIQEKEVYRIGSNISEKVDVRILVASNKDLYELVELNRFRQDLFYRLNVLTVSVPPLRERGDDILLLTNYFSTKFSREFSKPVPEFNDDVLEVFSKYIWPGNVRELENLIHRLIIMNDGECIKLSDLPDLMKTRQESQYDISKPLKEVEKEHILNVLEYVDNNKSKAADILKIDRKTLHNKLKQYE